MTARRILGTLAIVMLVSVITPVSIPGTAATDLTLGVTILESLRLEVDQQSLTIAPVSVPTVSSPSQSAAFTPACLVSTRIFNNTERPCYLSIMAKTPLDGTAGQLSVDHLEWSADRRNLDAVVRDPRARPDGHAGKRPVGMSGLPASWASWGGTQRRIWDRARSDPGVSVKVGAGGE